jgi:hypothetical protein
VLIGELIADVMIDGDTTSGAQEATTPRRFS